MSWFCCGSEACKSQISRSFEVLEIIAFYPFKEKLLMITYSVTVPSKINSLQVYSLAASEPNIAPNKPRNFLWSADVNIDASLHLVILFKSMQQTDFFFFANQITSFAKLLLQSNRLKYGQVPRPLKTNQNCKFWYGNIPSGNPVMHPSRLSCLSPYHP